MSDQQAMPPNSMSQQFSEGTPVYDVNGEQMGTVSKHGLVENTLVLYKSKFFHRDIQVPLSKVQRSDSKGIYLSVSKNQLQHERYAAPPVIAESGAGELNSQGVDVIEQTPHTLTKGVGVIEQTPTTLAKGEDTIERNAEGPMSGEVSSGGK